MSKEIVNKKAAHPQDLTEMQRRFCEYLIMNEGRTTHQDAAIAAGYAPKNARFEAYGLMQNPKIQRYLAKRSNEVNRSFAVTKHNYVRRQQILSQKLVDEGKVEKAVGFENLIGKATGQFVDIHLHGKISDMTNEEKLEEIKRIKQIQNERVKALANSKE
jgi:phage terminase small subunit|tara:strand:+ start:606 stop:1085 length:480 start_codon:yes stop_codon:yes gene_type:complete